MSHILVNSYKFYNIAAEAKRHAHIDLVVYVACVQNVELGHAWQRFQRNLSSTEVATVAY